MSKRNYLGIHDKRSLRNTRSPGLDKLATALDRLIPKSLDGVITRHREHAELRLSTDDDLALLRANVPCDESYAQISNHQKTESRGNN